MPERRVWDVTPGQTIVWMRNGGIESTVTSAHRLELLPGTVLLAIFGGDGPDQLPLVLTDEELRILGNICSDQQSNYRLATAERALCERIIAAADTSE